MFTMECNVYDTELNRVGYITTWVSMVWQENYNTDGSFQLELQQKAGLMELFKPDYYCGLNDKDTLMIIKSVQVANGTIIINGFPATYIFADRVSTQIIQNQNAEQAMRNLVENMIPWPKVELGNLSGIADKFSAQKSDATLKEYFETIAQATDIGFRLRHDKSNKKLLFECYKPGENKNAKYSTDYGNMGSIEYSLSTVNYKNVAVVAGAGEGDDRITVLAGATETVGAERREMYVDARSEQLKEGESTETYKNRLKGIGEEKLIEQIKIENIKFTLDDERSKLGDIVFGNIPEIGVKVKVRIIGMSETSQDNGIVREASLGTPIIIGRH